MRCMSDRVCLSKGEKGQGSKSKILPCSVAAFFEDSQSLSEWKPGAASQMSPTGPGAATLLAIAMGSVFTST